MKVIEDGGCDGSGKRGIRLEDLEDIGRCDGIFVLAPRVVVGSRCDESIADNNNDKMLYVCYDVALTQALLPAPAWLLAVHSC